MKTVFAALHENNSETFSTKLKRIKTKIFIPKTSYADQLLTSLLNRSGQEDLHQDLTAAKRRGLKQHQAPLGPLAWSGSTAVQDHAHG
ncbi:hypothetical protein [Comamonas brasiliensis]|uniref:hypothetical protein n=1 Tax=Comamonas brasiliensis TaxID=1812482 RepID=UPI001B8AFCAB|nr:hypothetical protein [Comamonas sp. PE63]